MLTDKAIAAAKPREKDYKLADSGGLYLFVTAKGHRSWRLKYRHGGKEHRLVFGAYPEISLKVARARREEVRLMLREGRDPKLEARRLKLVGEASRAHTFEKVAREWHRVQAPRWKAVHADDVITSIERDLFPHIGDYPLAQIDEPLMLAVLKKVEDRGAIETARRLRQRAERIFRYAKASGIPNTNPAADVKEAMKPVPPQRRWPAIIDLKDLQTLVATVDHCSASPVTRLASRFLGLTAQRPGMVRGAVWTEFEGIDWGAPDASSPEAIWRIPASRMKLEFDLRDDEAFEHLVPLAPQAVDVLRTVRKMTGRGPLPFCSSRNAHEPMSENAIGYLYNREGYKGRHVPHGWRSSFSTIMNGRAERLYHGMDRVVIDRLIIDLMLAHAPIGMSAAEFRYNRAAYMDRRRELANEWANLLLAKAFPPEDLLQGRRRRRN